MAPRSLATGTISFGLVSIPIRLYAATQPAASVSFNLLHAKDGARLKQQFICSKDSEKVERDETVKGYEFQKDHYVTFTTEELRALDEIASQTIDIAEFVPTEKVDPVFFDRAYYLGPDRGGAKAYRLLALALERSGKAALGRYAARGKQYLVLIRARGGHLVMQQLYYADEVRPPEEVELPDAQVTEAEVELALRLIDQTSSDTFEPKKYEDTVKKRTLEAIERKIAGLEIQVAAPEPQAQVIDLMDALKASIAAGEGTASPKTAVRTAVASPEEAPGNAEPAKTRHSARRTAPAMEAARKKSTSRK